MTTETPRFPARGGRFSRHDARACQESSRWRMVHRAIDVARDVRMAGATTIQCAWRCNRARHGIRLQVQVYLTRIAEEAAAAEAQRMELERQNSPCRSR